MLSTKKVNVMSKYVFFVLLALQILCCESVESVNIPRGTHRVDVIGRNRNIQRRRDFKIRPTSLLSVDTKKAAEVTVVAAVIEPEITLNAFDLCLCGAFATAFGDFVMHPVDTIKVSQQVTRSNITHFFYFTTQI